MTVTKTIVCLANSKKHGGTCVAGIELLDSRVGDWVRPVSVRAGHEVSIAEQTTLDGLQPQVLDVISIGLLQSAASGYQSENWVLDDTYRWIRVGRWSFADLASVIDTTPTLWTNESSSTVGIHDRVAEKHLSRHTRSIGLIHADAAAVVVSKNPWSGDTEVRLRFDYGAVPHELKITDSTYHAHYRAKGVGHHLLSEETLVTVSLAEPYTAPQAGAEAYSYKVVAAIIEPVGTSGGAP